MLFGSKKKTIVFLVFILLILIFHILQFFFSIVSLSYFSFIAMGAVFLLFLLTVFFLFSSHEKLKEEKKAGESLSENEMGFMENLLDKSISILQKHKKQIDKLKNNPLENDEKKFFDLKEKLQNYEEFLKTYDMENFQQFLEVFQSVGTFLEIYFRIPYIKLFLEKVIEKTETAAMNLIEKFDVVSNENSGASRKAEESLSLLKNKEGISFEELIHKSKDAFSEYSEMIKELKKINEYNQEESVKISHLIEQSKALLDNILNISKRNRVISLNLSIEAVKAGQTGLRFKVIVNEIQKMNAETNHLINGLGNIVNDFKNYHDKSLKAKIEKTVEIVENLGNSNKRSEEVLSLLIQSYESSANLSISLSQSTMKVNRSMDNILESLQFQDITRQQIENIIHFLAHIQEIIKTQEPLLSRLGYSFEKPNQNLQKSIIEDFQKNVKIEDEKIVLNSIQYQ
ncbi:MAG TPA: hypothetical protein DHW82_09815 [Spirochaetia bacterium]|nr:MAG: hypothetical protein A2Y41_10305 [Spirochaetes bacterium GWB1_36_13]HCL57287.1 hypothetical protein [Spirochaetia bacterium]